jgi:hypothetical protein
MIDLHQASGIYCIMADFKKHSSAPNRQQQVTINMRPSLKISAQRTSAPLAAAIKLLTGAHYSQLLVTLPQLLLQQIDGYGSKTNNLSF